MVAVGRGVLVASITTVAEAVAGASVGRSVGRAGGKGVG